MDVREKASNGKRLIDANALMKDACAEGAYGYVDAKQIAEAPTVDAVEVVHGRWRCHGDCGVTECSVCGWSIEEYVGDYAYCPNCGAKMDGGAE